MTRAERKKELRSKAIFAVAFGVVSFGWLVPVGMKYHEDYVVNKPVVEEPLIIETETEIIRWKDMDVSVQELENVVTVQSQESELTSLGVFRITAYCPCTECSDNWGTQTATGAVATEGRTIAVDPDVIPYGTVLIINGHEYVAENCGGAIKGNEIDIYFDSHQEAREFGVQHLEVFIKQNSTTADQS